MSSSVRVAKLLAGITLGTTAILVVAAGSFGSCGGDPGTPPGSLTYYTTCGDPVCTVPDMGGWRPKTGIPLCTTEKVGDPCTPDGKQCDPKSDCNETLLCASKDPKSSPGGCPISRRAYKTDIAYLDHDGLKRYADELSKVRLATYKYKSGGPTHLGFIIEDVEPSVSVDSPRDMVDLYGYTSMAVAALKLQEKKLALMEEEIATLKKALKARGRAK